MDQGGCAVVKMQSYWPEQAPPLRPCAIGKSLICYSSS